MDQTIACSLENILKKVQICKSSHQKNIKVLEQLYLKVGQEEFLKVLFAYLKKKIFPIKNEYVERILLFLSQFIAYMTPVDDNEMSDDDDSPSHPFLRQIVSETLKCHIVQAESVRYNSCLFVRLILQNIGHETRLDNDICDCIQEAMLERTHDPKPAIRQQAVLALLRLQDPFNLECPVIKTYLLLIVDSNSLIRADVVKNIAPYSLTIPHILNRLKDTDKNVRMMAFRRCADLGPKPFKIIERQHVINCGLTEQQPTVKKVFVENLLMKWLNVYNKNFLEFFNGLKLDADENDIITTEEIIKEVLMRLIETVPIKEIMATLPLNNKLIPFEHLTSEAVTVWNVVSNFLRQSEDTEELLNFVLPELAPFCDYVESVINKKNEGNPMDDWEYLNYQYIMYSLFEIVEKYDLADEVGRRKLNQLTLTILKDEDLQYRLLKKIVVLARKLNSDYDKFIDIISHLISEIREPLVEKIIPSENNPETSFLKAQLKVKLNILESQLEDATDMQEFLKANSLKEEIDKLKKELGDLIEPQPTKEIVKVSKDDSKTICRCLDLLNACLELPSTNKLTTFLITIKDEFVLPLLNSTVTEVNWRVLNCLGLYCLLDAKLAEEYVKILVIPIITYRAILNYDKLALTTSVKAISDLFRLYGTKIFGDMEESSQNSVSLNHTKRRLYRNEDDEESVIDPSRFHFDTVIEIMLDMLDDENADIRNCAVVAIAKLILSNFPVTPLFMTRILLKWYNPLTGRMLDNVQPILGVAIGNYANSVNGAKDIISKAVVPILTRISSAPKTSPLSDVDVDNMLQFLAAVTNTGNKRDIVNIHCNLAHILCHEISKKKDSSVVLYFAKMLVYLDIPLDNHTSINELKAQVRNNLDDEAVDKLPKKYLQKFLDKLCYLSNQPTSCLDTINESSCQPPDKSSLENDEQIGNNERNKENEKGDNDINESENDYTIQNNSSDTNSKADVESEKENCQINHVEQNRTEYNANKEKNMNVQHIENKQEKIQSVQLSVEKETESNLEKNSNKNQNNSDKNEMDDIHNNCIGNNRIYKNKRTIGKKKNKKDNDQNNPHSVLSNNKASENINSLKRTRNQKNMVGSADISTTDSETDQENKRRKTNNQVNIEKTTKSKYSQKSRHPTSLNEDVNNKRLNKVDGNTNNNNLTTDNDSGSPKRKKLKVLSVKLIHIDNMDVKRTRKKLIKNDASNIQKKNVDGTMNFSNINLSNCSFKPVIESTAISNGTLPESTLSGQRRSTRNGSHRNSSISTSEETILHTIRESPEIQMSRLSASPFSTDKSITSERSLRSRSISLSNTPTSSGTSGSPILKMRKPTSRNLKTPSRSTRATSKSKQKK